MSWLLPVVLVPALVVAAGCSGGSVDVDVARPTPTEVPSGATTVETPTATASPGPSPTPTSTPVPVAAVVVAADASPIGDFELVIEADPPVAFSFSGRFDTAAAAVELAFELEDYLALAALADPTFLDDPFASEASSVLGGRWVVRVVERAAYVQQPVLVAAAGGDEGDWVLVDDPALVDLLAAGGALGGGLDHEVVVAVIRSGGGAVVSSVTETLGGRELTRHELALDGGAITVRGRSPADTAALLGIDRLHLVDTEVTVWVDGAGRLQRARFEVPDGGFGDGTAPAAVDIAYSGLGTGPRLTVPSPLVAPS